MHIEKNRHGRIKIRNVLFKYIVFIVDVHLLKDLKAFDNLSRFNEYMGEQFVSAMIRSDYTEARALGRPCQEVVTKFIKQRRERAMFTADRIEERAALKQLNEAGRSVYPKPKRDDSKLNLIFRLFSSDRTKITQVKDRDGELPMMTGSFFGTGMD